MSLNVKYPILKGNTFFKRFFHICTKGGDICETICFTERQILAVFHTLFTIKLLLNDSLKNITIRIFACHPVSLPDNVFQTIIKKPQRSTNSLMSDRCGPEESR